MRWGIVTAVTSVLAFLLGLPYGALGVAVAYAVSEYLRTPFLWLYVGKSGPLQAHHVLRAAMPFVLGAHLAMGAVWLLKPLLPQMPLLAIGCAALVSYAITGIVGLAFASGREAFAVALKLIPTRPLAAAPSTVK